jgi:chromosome partitioning protein
VSIPIIAFFNNKGGVGKTSLVYHLAWMYRDLGLRVVAIDLDPQANLTAAFLDEDRLEEIWAADNEANTVFRCIQPLIRGVGDIAKPVLEPIDDGLSLLCGDLDLSKFEDNLSAEWAGCLDRQARSFQVVSAFWRLIKTSIHLTNADVVFVDLGPNLGAINRTALISTDYIIVPLAADLFSLQGLENLGLTLNRWRIEWQERITKNSVPELNLPIGIMQPIGYIVLQHAVRFDRSVKSSEKWLTRIPKAYSDKVIQTTAEVPTKLLDDPNCLALLKHYQSLMPMAQEARKAMFQLKPADGAIGAHSNAVQGVYWDFKRLAQKIAQRTQMGNLPDEWKN